MNLIKSTFVMAAFLTLSTSVLAAPNPTLQADRASVNSACAADAKTANCPASDVFGTGLLECIHQYKKANRKTFQISSGCQAAIEKLRTDRPKKPGAAN